MAADASQVQDKPRLHGLDYLRGLAAVGIMTYHYSSWAFGEQEAGSVLGRLGIYGVAVFYVLSGQALSYMYSSRLTLTGESLRKFYKKRAYRILPLLWLATFLSIVLSKRLPNVFDLLLNLTGLFGLLKWDTYFATGAWSIGNELTFYLAFPFLVFLFDKTRAGWILAATCAFSALIYFSFHRITPAEPLSSQWHLYTNPANQFAYFLGGTVIGRFVNPEKVTARISMLVGAMGVAIFLLVPVGSSVTELVTGWNRLFFTGSSFLLCYSFFQTSRAIALLDKPLAALGQASYSLYLLHPIVYAVVKVAFSLAAKTGVTLSALFIALLSGFISIAVSYVSYHRFEKFFITLSHKRPDAKVT